MMKVQKCINQLENEPCVRRYNDLADYWYVFDDILEFVFDIQNPKGWLESVKRNPVLWIQLSDYLFEFPIENPHTKLIEQKQCTTEYRLGCFWTLSLNIKF